MSNVVLAGVHRDPTEQALKVSVRQAAEGATDFSWLSRGDAVFIKPASNSGNAYPPIICGLWTSEPCLRKSTLAFDI